MEINKGKIVTSECQDLTSSALGVCKVDSFPVFVSNLLPHEICEVLILKKLSKYAFGKAINLRNEHMCRVKPTCPLFPQCGGCQTMHMSYDFQKDFKRRQVIHDLKRNGNIEFEVNETLGMDDPYYYRNKVIVPISVKDQVAGFYRVNSHKIVDMEMCYIQHPLLNQVYQQVKKYLLENEEHSVISIILRIGEATNEVMLALAIRDIKLNDNKAFIDFIVSKFPEIKSVQLNIHQEESNVMISDYSYTIYGSDSIREQLHHLIFNISLNSFFQVNSKQTEVLYNLVVKAANITKTDTVLDLYCGVGTIALFMALHAKKVIGVDIVESAIEDARANAELNNLKNVEFVCQDATLFIQRLKEESVEIDTVIVDPPRKGLTEQGISDLLTIGAQKIVYVSCNPQTLGRDLSLLTQTYCLEMIQPVDLFPQTSHVETVVLMSRVDN